MGLEPPVPSVRELAMEKVCGVQHECMLPHCDKPCPLGKTICSDCWARHEAWVNMEPVIREQERDFIAQREANNGMQGQAISERRDLP